MFIPASVGERYYVCRQEEMRDLTRQVVNRLYTFQAKAHHLHFVAMMDRALAEAWRWDDPEGAHPKRCRR